MRKHFLLKTMLLLCALIVGSSSAWAEDEPSWSYTVVNGDASKLNTTAKTFTVDATHVWSYEGTTVKAGSPTVTIGKSTNYALKFGNSGSEYFSPVILSTNAFSDKAVTKVSLYLKHNGKKVGTLTVKQGDVTIGTATSSNSSDWITVTCSQTNKGQGGKLEIKYEVAQALYINKIEVWYEELSTDPSISASNVNIAYDATGGSIAYDINNGVEGGSVSAAVKDGNWITLGQGTASPISFTCSANSETTARTATVTLTYTYNNTETVTKDVTITQAAAPVVYTTIPALFAAATSTETEVKVTFNNWVVSGVSTSGKNVFVTDNNGNGFMIYSSSDQSNSYSVGDILSGTAISCSLVLYGGYAEITGLDASDLTITSGGTVSVSNIAMADLAGVNTGALVSYNGLTCSIDNNKYYLTDGTTTIQLHNSLYAFGALEAGEKYNITGIYQQYNDTKEILPRSASDIVKVVVPKHTLLVLAENGSVEIAGQTLDEDGVCEINEGASVTATATPNAYYTFTSWTAEGITLEDATANPLTFTMPNDDVILTANFTEMPYHSVTFYVNGSEYSDDILYEGEAITFPSVTAPTGYAFMGWTTTDITAAQAAAPADLTTTATMGDEDVNYYAVFAVVSGTPATLTKMASTDTFEDGDKVVIVANDGEKDYAIYQETQNTSWVGKYEFDGNVSTVAADDKNWLTVTADGDNWKLGDATNGYLYSSTSNNLILDTDNSSSFTLGYSNGNGFTLKKGNRWLSLRTDAATNKFRLGGDGSTPLGTGYFDIYKYVAGSATYSDYCTTVTKEIATVTSYGWATYIPSHAVEFPANRAYVVTEVSNEGKTTVEAVEKVPAGTPLLLKGEGQVTADIIDEEVDAPTTNMLSIGTGTTPEDKYPYVLAKNGEGKAGFKLWTGAASVLKDRVVMMLDSEISGNGSRNFLFLEDGETTAIDVRSKMDDVRGEYFNLNGQRVAQPTKGLYIVNGRKVVIK